MPEKTFKELHSIDRVRPIVDKMISNHAMFESLKTAIATLENNRNRKRRNSQDTFNGFRYESQYLSFITPSTKAGDAIANTQREILKDIGLLDASGFAWFRTLSVDWDKAKALYLVK